MSLPSAIKSRAPVRGMIVKLAVDLSKNNGRQGHYRRLYARRHRGWRPAATLLRDTIEELARTNEAILDLGCGRNTVLGPTALGSMTVGMDPNAATLLRNDVVSHRVLGSGDRLPFKDGSFGIVLSTFVVEHLDRPTDVVAEVRRVLRPGGCFVFLTPNAWNYASWIIRAVPHRWHGKLARSMWGRDPGDTFRTRYRMNTPARTRRIMRRAGLVEDKLVLNGDPTYVVFNDATFSLACLVERALERPRLAWARVHMLGVFRKPA